LETDAQWCFQYGAQVWSQFGIALLPSDLQMQYVSAGTFQMGDAYSEGEAAERPLHQVSVSALYMDRDEVSGRKWKDVYDWAVQHGYVFDAVGSSYDLNLNHPVWTVTWYDCVKWCNARSEKEGRLPAYYITSSLQPQDVYRTGRVDLRSDWVRWDAGYRLPTEAEWEKAARGGAVGYRFPWSDTNTISHARANYYSTPGGYDADPAGGYHPSYCTDPSAMPYTCPVTAFDGNGYGLHNMAGNVLEWCWDWYSETYYGESFAADPRGPTSGGGRVVRGGAWWASAGGFAYDCRAARRNAQAPNLGNFSLGFRTVLPGSLEMMRRD
jgi:formylglycine-generating enzyme required for sulfatase activity